MNLFETYTEMLLVVNQPELFGLLGAVEAFDVDPKNTKFAFTIAQGVFEPPLVNGEDNRARHIRLGLAFFAPTVSADFAAFILIHELAHFTSRRDGQIIGDEGRGGSTTCSSSRSALPSALSTPTATPPSPMNAERTAPPGQTSSRPRPAG